MSEGFKPGVWATIREWVAGAIVVYGVWVGTQDGDFERGTFFLVLGWCAWFHDRLRRHDDG